MYLGGHANHNLTFLPHDLPVHRGFDGCIFDFSMRADGGTVVSVGHFNKDGHNVNGHTMTKGRNVFQCHANVCSPDPCRNGGTCVGYGSSYM